MTRSADEIKGAADAYREIGGALKASVGRIAAAPRFPTNPSRESVADWATTVQSHLAGCLNEVIALADRRQQEALLEMDKIAADLGNDGLGRLH